MKTNPKFDVIVKKVTLEDNPARITLSLDVAGHLFTSKIYYESIPSWDKIWSIYGETIKPELIGMIVAWDCMRFLALGGERVVLCDGLYCDEETARVWQYSFKRQLGEWRYLNEVQYPTEAHPLLVSPSAKHPKHSLKTIPPKKKKALLTSGGGKDTLAGMLILRDANIEFDTYEGYMPLGGDFALQKELLKDLRTCFDGDLGVISVKVEDDFFSCDDAILDKMGVTAKHTKIDFMVGHTANYVGYFPVILYHKYTKVYFNIERSSERDMVFWHGEGINHQWIKSSEYQKISHDLFQKLTGQNWFHGFDSSLRGLYDLQIYSIVAQYPEFLYRTHSCNYGKPWCNKCPKCCFCYLMMSAFIDETYSMQVVRAKKSLFENPANREHWENLLDDTKVAWECVPASEECLLAVHMCLNKGIDHEVLQKFKPDKEKVDEIWKKHQIDYNLIPHELHASIRRLISGYPLSKWFE